MAQTNSKILADLRKKLGDVSHQAIQQRRAKLQKLVQMPNDIATYVVASREGVRLDRELDVHTLERVALFDERLRAKEQGAHASSTSPTRTRISPQRVTTPAPRAPRAAARGLSGKPSQISKRANASRLSRLHPKIQAASGDLLRDGHPAAAVLEAFKAVEVRVKEVSGLRGRYGRDLMAAALGQEPPAVPLNLGESVSDADEQEGFKLIFMGAAQGIRNPKAHDPFTPLEADRAYEYLAFASLLMRRLDDAASIKSERTNSS